MFTMCMWVALIITIEASLSPLSNSAGASHAFRARPELTASIKVLLLRYIGQEQQFRARIELNLRNDRPSHRQLNYITMNKLLLFVTAAALCAMVTGASGLPTSCM